MYRDIVARFAAAAVVLQEFLHAFRQSLPPAHTDVKLQYPISHVHGWSFGNESQSAQGLRVLIEARRSSMRQLRNAIPAARITTQ
jgi:hypothetical protein